MTLPIPFFERVKSFNKMYGLPTPSIPTAGSPQELRSRLLRFKEILQDEVNEVDDIINAIDSMGNPSQVMTMLADWLGDISVYAASEAQRHGLPLEYVLSIIMDSNESKLGADGKPIVENGKVIKGPNYWKPEPKIQMLLESLVAISQKEFTV